MVITQQLVVVNPTTTHSERKPRRTTQSMNKGSEEPLFNYRKYSFASAVEGKFKTKKKMLTTYGKLKEKSKDETQKQSKELSKLSGNKVSFTTARNLTTNSLNLAIANEEGVSEVEFKMDRFSILDKIVFHKGFSDLIYADLTKEASSHLRS